MPPSSIYRLESSNRNAYSGGFVLSLKDIDYYSTIVIYGTQHGQTKQAVARGSNLNHYAGDLRKEDIILIRR